MKNRKPPFIVRAIVFSLERFPLQTHGLYAVFLLAAAVSASGQSDYGSWRNLVILMMLIIMLLLLRLFDDVKDLEIDRAEHPDRPLPRGLLSRREALAFASTLIAILIVVTGLLTVSAIPAVAMYLSCAFLLFRGFFVKSWIEAIIPLFVWSHTAIGLALIVTIYSMIDSAYFWVSPDSILMLGLITWFASALFDFSRKMLLPGDDGYEKSYTAAIGIRRVLVYATTSATLLLITVVILGAMMNFGDLFLILTSFVCGTAIVVGLFAIASKNAGLIRFFRIYATGLNLLCYVLIAGAGLWA